MGEQTIEIMLNEKHRTVDRGTTVGSLRDLVKPGADVIVVNGYPSDAANELNEGDQVVLIRRGGDPRERGTGRSHDCTPYAPCLRSYETVGCGYCGAWRPWVQCGRLFSPYGGRDAHSCGL